MVPALKCSDWLIRLASAYLWFNINDWVALVVCGVVGRDARTYVFPLGSCLYQKLRGYIRRNWNALLHRNPKEERVFDAPTPIQSQLLAEIRKLKESPNGGVSDTSIKFSRDFQEKILTLLDSPDRADDFGASQKIFEKLLNDPSARSKLESLHTARSFKFGAAHFGPKNWYKEAQALSKKLKSQSDRRKFRHGLKGDVVFINYMNIKNLEDLLADGDPTALKLLNLDEGMNLFFPNLINCVCPSIGFNLKIKVC